MEFPHGQIQQRLGVLHQHLRTWVRNAYCFRSDYYLGNTKKKMIHTIRSNGREETNIIFNYLKCSVMTHIGLGHFQNQLLFSSNTLLLTIEENKLLAIQDNKQDQSAFNRTIQILKKEGEGFPPKCPPPHKTQNTRSSVDYISLGKGQKAHQSPNDNYAYLSFFLAAFAKTSLQVLLQQVCYLPCFSRIGGVLSHPFLLGLTQLCDFSSQY